MGCQATSRDFAKPFRRNLLNSQLGYNSVHLVQLFFKGLVGNRVGAIMGLTINTSSFHAMVILTKKSLEIGYEASRQSANLPCNHEVKTQYRPAQLSIGALASSELARGRRDYPKAKCQVWCSAVCFALLPIPSAVEVDRKAGLEADEVFRIS